MKTYSNSKKSFSELNILPGTLFMECFETLLPHITCILNNSLTIGLFPSNFKKSLVIPLLKKPSLDRLVSNLSFISKILERIVFKQITDHLIKNNLIDTFQSAYKSGHSTDTALLRVVNDLFCFIDEGNVSLLTMLDLRLLDTIDHDILFQRLPSYFSINDKVGFIYMKESKKLN